MHIIRQVQYSADSVSIQVYKIENLKRNIVKHIGTARNEQEESELLQIAGQYIQKQSKQIRLFEKPIYPSSKFKPNVVHWRLPHLFI